MKKLLSLGLVLLTIVYALPLVYNRYYDGIDAQISQDSLPVTAETNLPKEADQSGADTQSGTAESGSPAQGEKTTVTDQSSIRVLVDGEVRTMPLETYVAGVVAAEISPTFPPDALRAQAVAARTYAVYKMESGNPPAEHKGADVCDDYHHCTAYMDLTASAAARWGGKADTYENAIEQAVKDTAGEILTVNDKPIVAVFSAASGPKTESAGDVWGSNISYLQSVVSPGGDACPKYNAEVTVEAAEFREKVKKTFPTADVSGAPSTWFKASVRSNAGGVKTVTLGGVRVEGTAVRELFALNSTNFTLTTTEDNITFHTVGYGHGVGLSQYGAKYMAEHGSSYQDILTHYFTGAKITKI
ncbi:MAG: stage II sporulation protein D [Intestinibacillus sp.]